MDVGQAFELLQTAGADPLQVMAAGERVVSWAQARQLTAIREMTEQEPEHFDNFGDVVDPVPSEIATYLSWGPWAATRRVELSEELHECLPGVLAALREGQLDLPKVQEIVSGTAQLQPGDRVELADRAVAYAGTHTRTELRAWLTRWVAKVDPEAAAKRRKKAKTHRRVWVQPEADGMATLGAFLTAEEAQSCYQNLCAGAAGHTPIDAARADLLVERLSGVSPTEPIPIQIIETPAGPELAGHGPIAEDHYQQLAKDAPRISLKRPPMTLSYTPTAAQKTFIRIRDRRCQFKGCRRPAVFCDSDHIINHPDGLTDVDNLHCLCRYHHRQKTFAGWTVIRHPDGSETWISPRGHRYTVRPDDP